MPLDPGKPNKEILCALRLCLCEKALAEYLDTKRLAFPRFYFLSSSDLLDILSNGTAPQQVSGKSACRKSEGLRCSSRRVSSSPLCPIKQCIYLTYVAISTVPNLISGYLLFLYGPFLKSLLNLLQYRF